MHLNPIALTRIHIVNVGHENAFENAFENALKMLLKMLAKML